MPNENPIFSQVVMGGRVGRGPIVDAKGMPMNGSHRGVDIAVPQGTDIHPVTSGKVVFAGSRADYGNVVVVKDVIDNATSIYSLYAHMRDWPSVKNDDVVTKDSTLGLSGHTGKVYGVTGDHLHFEMVRPLAGHAFD